MTVKRSPCITRLMFDHYHLVSKADLAEAAINLSAQAIGSCDDLDAGTRRLLAEINLVRSMRGARPISTHRVEDEEED